MTMADLFGAWRPWFVAATLSFTAVSMVACRAEASVVYQSIPDLTVAPFGSYGYCSQCFGDGQQIGQVFSIADPATIGSATFATSSDFFWPSPVTVTVYQDLGGTLGTQVYNQTFSTFASDV